jgi:hypothetical protein
LWSTTTTTITSTTTTTRAKKCWTIFNPIMINNNSNKIFNYFKPNRDQGRSLLTYK